MKKTCISIIAFLLVLGVATLYADQNSASCSTCQGHSCQKEIGKATANTNGDGDAIPQPKGVTKTKNPTITADLELYGKLAMDFFQLPSRRGGGGSGVPGFGSNQKQALKTVGAYIGFTDGDTLRNETGIYTLKWISDIQLSITGKINRAANPGEATVVELVIDTSKRDPISITPLQFAKR